MRGDSLKSLSEMEFANEESTGYKPCFADNVLYVVDSPFDKFYFRQAPDLRSHFSLAVFHGNDSLIFWPAAVVEKGSRQTMRKRDDADQEFVENRFRPTGNQ
jgi:hypothetical protein